LARRLKRLLTIGDFTVCPVNRLACAAVGKISLVAKGERQFEKTARRVRRRASQEQERQLLLDYGDDQEWEEWQDCIWSPS
jgi:hypothetical protein